jgi:hypothetical protein
MPGPIPITPSRVEPWTLVPAARALYEQGLTRSQVLQAIYGVDLPREAMLFFRDFVKNDDDDPPVEASWGTLPWELMIPLEDGGPQFEIPPHEAARDARIYATSPSVLLLGRTGYDETPTGASLIGYDLDELRAGRTTVVGLSVLLDVPGADARFTVFGSSLVDVFRDMIVRYRALMEEWIKTGVGGDSYEDVHRVSRHLASIEALQRELAA